MRDDGAIGCAQFDEASWLLLSGELDDGTRPAWEAHVAGCDACAHLLAERRRLLDLYDGLAPNPVAPPAMPPVAKAHGSLWQRPAMALAAGLVLAAGGVLVGRATVADQSRTRPQQVARTSADLELQLAMARIAPASAAERLKATAAVGALVGRDGRALESLLDVLESDPSPNVRMAAIDALYRAGDAAVVERRFAALMAAQASPAISIALIELAADRKFTGALRQLEQVAAESSDSVVSDRARWAVEQLTRGV